MRPLQTAWRPTVELGRVALVPAVFLFLGLLLGEPTVVLAAAPFLLALALAAGAPSDVAVLGALELDADRCSEGDTVVATVRLGVTRALARVVVALDLPDGLRPLDPPTVLLRIGADEEVTVRVRLAADGWGRHPVGPVRVTAAGPFGLQELAVAPLPAAPLRVQPAAEPFDAEGDLPQPLGLVGSHRARRRGDGAEFDVVRRYVPGDPVRRIDWRATARTGELQVDATQPERGADVVVLLDTTVDARAGARSSLDTAVRACLGICRHFLDRGDRVGVAAWSGRIDWLPAAAGRLHHERIVEWLLDRRAGTTGVAQSLARLAGHVLPPRALVVVLSPLLEAAVIGQVADLARRGRPLLVVDTLPAGVPPPPTSPEQEVAQRLWRLDRDDLLARLAETGVPVAPWRGPGSLDLALSDVGRLTRGPRIVSR